MAVIKTNPTSAGRRHLVKIVNPDLHTGSPYKPLLSKLSKTGGRNNNGRITVRHIGGGHKRHYRMIDFHRNKLDISAVVERVEYDPNRSSYIALLKYLDGERRYILSFKGAKVGSVVLSGSKADIIAGNALPLYVIPLGSMIHCVEMKPGKGGQLARSAGSSVQLAAKEGRYATLKMPSGVMRKVDIIVMLLLVRSLMPSMVCVL